MTRLSQWSERVTLAMLTEYWNTSIGPGGDEQRLAAARPVLEREVRELAFNLAYYIRDSGENYKAPPTTDRVNAWLDQPTGEQQEPKG